MKRVLAILGVCVTAAQAHDIITTPITFDREIVRIFQARCLSCHHEGGSAFSLASYADARPWAVAIKEEVLTHRMPPWGAVKGFGEFRNDQALTPEQFELITSWTDGGVPEGEPKDMPPPPKFPAASALEHRHGELAARGDFQLTRPFVVDALLLQDVPDKVSSRIVAQLPDGGLEPLVWLLGYKPQFAHVFLLRQPLHLPKGTIISGIPDGATLLLEPPEPVHAGLARSK